MATLQRVQKLVQQLAPAPARQSSTAATSSSTSSLASLQVSQETAALAAERANAKFNVDALHRVMAGEHIATKLKAFKYMQDDPLFRLDFSKIKSQEEHREWVNQVLKKIAASRVFSLDELETAPMKMADALDAFSYLDGSVSVKIGVHYGLWGSSIFNLASEEQKAKYMKDTDLLNIVGCFALTELKQCAISLPFLPTSSLSSLRALCYSVAATLRESRRKPLMTTRPRSSSSTRDTKAP